MRVAVRGPAQRKRKWTAALIASCILHAAIALFFIGTSSEEALLQGSELSGIALLGSAPEDQISAGDLIEKDDPNAVAVTMITMLEAKPVETVKAETVPTSRTTETVEMVKAEPLQTEMLQPVAEQALEEAPPDEPLQADPAERVETVPPAAAEPSPPAVDTPEILATDTLQPVEDDQAVPEISEVAPAEPVETALEPTRTEIVEAEPVIPLDRIPPLTGRPAEMPAKQAPPKPKPTAKVAQAEKPANKPVAKPAAKARQSGNGGQNRTDAQRGQADGLADGRTAGKTNGRKSSEAGNAAVSNYPGKVASKLRRALRYPAEARRQKLRGQVHVSFVVSTSGGVRSIRVVVSSGSPVLDRAAIETVRRAAPFPNIPPEAARSSWPFTVPLAFNR